MDACDRVRGQPLGFYLNIRDRPAFERFLKHISRRLHAPLSAMTLIYAVFRVVNGENGVRTRRWWNSMISAGSGRTCVTPTYCPKSFFRFMRILWGFLLNYVRSILFCSRHFTDLVSRLDEDALLQQHVCERKTLSGQPNTCYSV